MNRGKNVKIQRYARQRYDQRVASLEAIGEKLCPKCQKILPLAAFDVTRRRHGGHSYGSWCKLCGVEMRRTKRLLESFLLSPTDWDRVLVLQKHCCALCERPETHFTRRLAVDHDHKTGLVRGGLCYHCNKILGIARDNPKLLMMAALYILHPPATVALGRNHFGLPGRTTTRITTRRKLAKKVEANRNKILAQRKNDLSFLLKALDYLKNPPAEGITE